jgi:hypothetical protein
MNFHQLLTTLLEMGNLGWNYRLVSSPIEHNISLILGLVGLSSDLHLLEAVGLFTSFRELGLDDYADDSAPLEDIEWVSTHLHIKDLDPHLERIRSSLLSIWAISEEEVRALREDPLLKGLNAPRASFRNP